MKGALRRIKFAAILLGLSALAAGFLTGCDEIKDMTGQAKPEEELTSYEKELKEMSWYDWDRRDYREFKKEDLDPYLEDESRRPAPSDSSGSAGFNFTVMLYIVGGAAIVILLYLIFRNGFSFKRMSRAKDEPEVDIGFRAEAPRKRDPLFDDALKALEEERYSDVMEVLLEILVRFSHSENYLARRSGFTPREFQRMVRKVAPASFVQLADDLSPAFEETVYALRPRSHQYYLDTIHRMEKQLQGVGR